MRQLFRHACAAVFRLAECAGVHLTPKHYYTPVPDVRWLRQHTGLWKGAFALTDVDWNLDSQLDRLARICAPHRDEVAGLEFYRRATSDKWGPGYGPIESQVLHCFLRANRPRRVIEIGSGVSTACMLHGLDREAELTCIEPFPSAVLREAAGTRLMARPCQEVPLSVFQELREGDLLFIDSSHSVKIGSEVPRLYLEIIPSLRPGVFVHIHDIFLPYLYPPDLLTWPFWAWQETVLLAALLTHNPKLEVQFCLSALHHAKAAELRQVLPDYQPRAMDAGLFTNAAPQSHFPSSIWLRTGSSCG
jgi:predicted O-methyltransferase YrrM